MSKIIKILIISTTLGVLITLGTYFYQREGGYYGVCEIGQVSPCNGGEFKDRGYPVRYVNPESELNIVALLSNVVIWSILSFVVFKTIDTIKRKIR